MLEYDGIRKNMYGERLTRCGECFDPVSDASSSICHGRIGRAAWALFERGGGLVLSIDLPGEPLCVVPIDSESESFAFATMVAQLRAALRRVEGC